MPTFQATVTVLGLLLIMGALAADLAQRSLLSLAALFVLAGFALGSGGAGLIDFRAHSGFVEDLAFAALIVILFRDGLEVEGEMLQRAWHLPLRKLILAMPITAIVVATAGHLLFGLSWTESLLLGALLAPTDPILTSSIVTNPRVPRLVRHSLNLESGLNDGLALPAILTFLAALSTTQGHFVWWRFVLQDVGLGFLYGIACGWLASLVMPRGADRRDRKEKQAGEPPSTPSHEPPSTPSHEHPSTPSGEPPSTPSHQKSLFALGVAFATYGLTVLAPPGNGFIAVFVAITFLIARPLAVWLALLGTRTDRATRLFMGWFGPKGVATMTFSLLVLDQHIENGPRIFDLTALVVFCSIIVHGLSDTPGANWIARHAERTAVPSHDP